MPASTGTQAVDRGGHAPGRRPRGRSRPPTFTDLQRRRACAKSTALAAPVAASSATASCTRRRRRAPAGAGAHPLRPLAAALDELIALSRTAPRGARRGDRRDDQPRGHGRTTRSSRSPRSTPPSSGQRQLGRAMRLPLHCTALGKVFLASGAPAARRAARASHAAHDRQPRPARGRARAGARPGLGRRRSELEPGLVAIAAPVHGPGGDVVAALSISGPSVRIGRDQHESLGLLLTREADALSLQLGHTPDKSRKEAPHDSRRDPQGPLRRDAGRQRAGRQGPDQPGPREGHGPGPDAVRGAHPVAGGGRRPLRARRLLRARRCSSPARPCGRAGHPAPAARRRPAPRPVGTFLMGTVKGDVHDIGKNLFNIMLEGAGFPSIDLGVQVPPEKFVDEIERAQARRRRASRPSSPRRCRCSRRTSTRSRRPGSATR